MKIYLRLVAVLVVVGGIAVTARFSDEMKKLRPGYDRALLMNERNPRNMIFETELRMVEGRMFVLGSTAAVGFLTALIGGSLLWGLASVHSKIDRG